MIAAVTPVAAVQSASRAADTFLRGIQEAMQDDADLTLRQLRVLVALGDRPMSIKHLAPVVECQKPVISRCVARLVELGLVSKCRNAGDERMIDISRTRHGDRLVANLNVLVDRIVERLSPPASQPTEVGL